MSILTYNGIVLPYASTTRFNQEVVYDESDTDWYCTKFDIEVLCVINVDFMGQLAPLLVNGQGRPGTDNPAVIMKDLRSSLMQPRKALSFKFNGQELLPSRQAGNVTDIDARNGPRPQSCTLVQLNNNTFLMSYHVIAHYWENNLVDGNGNPFFVNQRGNPVLYNRWSETVELDSCQFTRRVREGKFVIRSDNKDGNIADIYRHAMANLAVPFGCLRESSSYTVTPDGMSIQYRLVDKEQYFMPPAPAFEAQGIYNETSTQGGHVRYGEVRVTLKGDKETDQNKLVEVAVGVCANKLELSGVQLTVDKKGGVSITLLEHASLTVHLYENIVECSLRALMKPRVRRPGARVKGIAGMTFSKLAGAPFSTPSGPMPPYKFRGSAQFLIRAAAYWDPSLVDNEVLPNTGQPATGVEPGSVGKLGEQQN